jgi:hypothetical protein
MPQLQVLHRQLLQRLCELATRTPTLTLVLTLALQSHYVRMPAVRLLQQPPVQ